MRKLESGDKSAVYGALTVPMLARRLFIPTLCWVVPIARRLLVEILFPAQEVGPPKHDIGRPQGLISGV